jgi:hypothetical protein
MTAEGKAGAKHPRETRETKIIGFRLPMAVSKAVKVEAARRHVALNVLFLEMWELYRSQKQNK